MIKNINDLADSVDSATSLNISLSNWRNLLSQECQVYVFGENYIAKRFDQINYKFCEKLEAKEILIDNLYALLRYKYFPKQTETVDDRIQEIVNSFTINLKSTLKKVSFDNYSDAEHVNMLPDYCIAFRNGVYDFLNNKWYFKYEIIKIEKLHNSIYMYDQTQIILWYLDFDFEPLPIDITKVSLETFIDFMKNITKENRNYCFELIYNISHDINDKFSINRFKHLCEILGYTCLNSFSQQFVMLIGSGQNGKNSLFDGCFTNKVIPRPAANDLDSIENDRFITGSLENKAHNIFLETSPKTYTDSKMIKALTGSMYQTIESKGVSKYSSVINCKYIFAGNDQEKIKFSDTTTGFKRRINVFEIWYRWDSSKRFLKKGDYFDTTFSDSLVELKNDISNITAYVYFAMYGLLESTKQFTKNFQFTYNDWKLQYTDLDFDLKDKIENITPQMILKYIKSTKETYQEGKTMFYDISKQRLYMSKNMKDMSVNNYDDLLLLFDDDERFISFFSENDIYIQVKLLQLLCKDFTTATTFTQTIKKLYSINTLPSLYNNKPYIKCTFINKKLKILN